MDEQATREELNRRYWESDESVSGIADSLDVSRRALYDAIDPLPADATCSACGGALGFRNRTSAENREAECRECGQEVRLDGDMVGAEPQVEQERVAGSLSPVRRSAPGSGPAAGVMLVLGMAVGAGAAYFFRRA
jgi:hypothetical protein